ncbi:ribonuclease 3 [Agaricicola taiwanensis]|uniref:Ribonuclease 3 n=1 Tax=Agaricicola taiwanensis TaxID=591372 RepID=A0A8J3DWH0_9RHOB|nr:ribonuclease III [Agaricicola taiwanensis]GGE46742.1 ribonuclease 3 [Agaricicola taiwanensis]
MKRVHVLAGLEAHLGYHFKDKALLEQALTHISALPNDGSRLGSYQRLEFLGDRVLGLAVCNMLLKAFPEAEEGELSRRLADLVRADTCAEVAAAMEAAPAIRLGAGEAHSGGRRKKAILADICEAIVGAVFLDGGLAAADELVVRFWGERLNRPQRPLHDAKTALQEWAQGRGLAIPLYREKARSGPDHDPVFRVTVSVAGLDDAEGTGRSKRVAEQMAAEVMLMREGVWGDKANG